MPKNNECVPKVHLSFSNKAVCVRINGESLPKLAYRPKTKLPQSVVKTLPHCSVCSPLKLKSYKNSEISFEREIFNQCPIYVLYLRTPENYAFFEFLEFFEQLLRTFLTKFEQLFETEITRSEICKIYS